VENRWYPAANRDARVEWDFEDRLVKVTKSDGTVVENVYDVDGVLVRTAVNGVGTDYLVDTSGGLSHVVAEVDSSGAVAVLYVRAGDMLLEEVRGGVAKMYEADGLGSVRGLLDVSGAKTDAYAYEAFGSTLSSTGSDANPYRFAGERFVESAGMYQNRARWLDTRTGRFVSVDPAEGRQQGPMTFHPYLYGNASPASFLDASGRETMVNLTVALIGVGILASIPGDSLVNNPEGDRNSWPEPFSESTADLDFTGRIRRLNKTEKAIALAYPSEFYQTLANGLSAVAETQLLFTPKERENGGPGNAFQHAYWNALMVNSVGFSFAKMVADAHEYGYKRPYDLLDEDSEMDLKNNGIGRWIGWDAYSRGRPASEMSWAIDKKLRRGEMFFIREAPGWDLFVGIGMGYPKVD
jgi:RHS repeat-associated protein